MRGSVSITTPAASKGKADAKSVPAAIHLDLDGSVHIYRVHGWQYKASSDWIFETGLRNALDFFDRAKVRATLFVIAEDLDDPRKRELLKDAVRRGHEIASHSLTHRKLTGLSRDEKRREIVESRERLSTELGVDVRGFRAPGFDIDRESLEFVDAAVYSYDSSLFPNKRFARKVGVPRLSESPHYPLENCGLLELPLPSYAPLPFPFHPCYSMVFGMWYFRWGLSRFQRTGAPLILLFHLADFVEPLPQNQLSGWRAKVYSRPNISVERKLALCEQMLELVKREYMLTDTFHILRRALVEPPPNRQYEKLVPRYTRQ